MKLFREELQAGIEEEDQVAFPELSPVDKPIMPPLYPLLIEFRTFIGIQLDLLKFVQLQQSFLPRRLQIKIKVLDSPVGFMLQLHGEMTSLTIDEAKRSCADRSFECRTVGPKGIIKFIRPILP